MTRGRTIDDVLRDSEQIARVWEANPTFLMSDVTRASVQTMIDELRQARAQTEDLRTQLTQKVNTANEKASALSSVVTRARAGIKGFFGPDSSQYEQAGGTRTSERKPRTARKATKTGPA